MICFDSEHGRFNFRSAAVIIHNDHLLIHRAVKDDFWALPGGRVELFETSEDAVKREIAEEIGAKCSVQRQLWQVESFFEYNSKRFHELGNYYLVSLIDHPTIQSEIDFEGIEKDVDLIFRWIPLSKISQYKLKPEFLIEKLIDLPESIALITINEIEA